MKANSNTLEAAPGSSAPLATGGGSQVQAGHPGHQPHQGGKKGPRIGLLLLGMALIFGVAFAMGLLPRLRERAVVLTETKDLATPTVAVIQPMQGKGAPPLVLSGELRAVSEASLYARASGYVRKWNVDLGAQVTQGQVLAELDTPELNRESAQARAELTQGEAALALAESTAKRWREMLAAKSVSPQEADEKIAEVELKRAMVEASKAKLQRLDDLLGYSKITAPFTGRITMRQLDVGQLVTEGGGKELFRLANVDQLRVFVRVPQSYARAVAVGQQSELTLPEAPGKKFLGQIVRTAGAVDASSRTLLVEIMVDNQKGELLAGSYAQVRLTEARPAPALTLPANTLLFRPEGTQVAVVKDSRLNLRVVTLGRDFGGSVEIMAGVDANDSVVVNPADSILDGQEVRLAEKPVDAKVEKKP
jgi:membrane fusion protein (multidrug efflux system)